MQWLIRSGRICHNLPLPYLVLIFYVVVKLLVQVCYSNQDVNIRKQSKVKRSTTKTLIKVTKFSSTECILQAEYLNFIGLWVSFDVRVHGDGGTEMAGACLWLSYIGAAEKMSRNEWEMWEKLFNTIIGSEQSCWPGLGCTRQQTIYLVISLLDSNNSNTRLWGLGCLDSIFPVRQVTRVMLVILVLSVMLVMLVTLCWPCSRWGGGTKVLTISSQ